MTITYELPPEIADRLRQKAAQEGKDTAEYLRQMAVREAEVREISIREVSTGPRVPGLHAGQYWIADDFDAPLPESFWLGGDDFVSEAGAE